MLIRLPRIGVMAALGLVFALPVLLSAAPPSPVLAGDWATSAAAGCRVAIDPARVDGRDALQVDYSLATDQSWVNVQAVARKWPAGRPLVFWLKVPAKAGTDLEIKRVAPDGSVFGKRLPLAGKFGAWTRLVVSPNSLEYWWGGHDKSGGSASVAFALSGGGAGRVWLSGIQIGPSGLPPSFPPAGPVLDPQRLRAGEGFAARRHRAMMPADPGVLAYLKALQDTSSSERQLLPGQEGDNVAQTFNNALVAMAFTITGERERAGRILDFYAGAMARDNADRRLQNFYFRGEARGFYQAVSLRRVGADPAHQDTGGTADRWVGDMAWLLLACRCYDRRFGSTRYEPLAAALHALFVSWFQDDGAGMGYVRHGWRHGDAYLHEKEGHEEGNIDCCAAFRAMGDKTHAALVRAWLTRRLAGRRDLPLDLYTWRVLVFGRAEGGFLNVPEYDLRYRKTVRVRGSAACGFYPRPDLGISNIWMDGLGHMACAQMTAGDRERGFFYADQMDSFLIDRSLGGVRTKALPFAANTTGEFGWVRPDRGFSSACAWYLFAKYRFNPLTLETGSR